MALNGFSHKLAISKPRPTASDGRPEPGGIREYLTSNLWITLILVASPKLLIQYYCIKKFSGGKYS